MLQHYVESFCTRMEHHDAHTRGTTLALGGHASISLTLFPIPLDSCDDMSLFSFLKSNPMLCGMG